MTRVVILIIIDRLILIAYCDVDDNEYCFDDSDSNNYNDNNLNVKDV
jgi:hypothetical protein